MFPATVSVEHSRSVEVKKSKHRVIKMKVGFLNWSKGPRITSRRSFKVFWVFYFLLLSAPSFDCLPRPHNSPAFKYFHLRFLPVDQPLAPQASCAKTNKTACFRQDELKSRNKTDKDYFESWSTRIQELKYGAGNERSRQRIKSYYSRAVTANTHWCIHMVTYSICTEVNPCQAMQMDTNLQSAFASRWVLKAHQLGFSHRLSWQRG